MVDCQWTWQVPAEFALQITIKTIDIDDINNDRVIIVDANDRWNVSRGLGMGASSWDVALLPTKILLKDFSTVLVTLYMEPVLNWKAFEIQLILVSKTGKYQTICR